MPICRECGRTLASAELRRLPHGGHRCKDRVQCLRVAARAEAKKGEKR